MSDFKIGDKVQMPGVPFVVEVLDIKHCREVECHLGIFRFKDPESGVDDWMHCNEFAKVPNA